MEFAPKVDIPYEEIQNGALLLLLLRECKSWEAFCGRYAHTDPVELQLNTNTMMLLKKLYEMRELGLVAFEDEATPKGKRPVGEIKETDLCSNFRVAFGGMSLSEAAMLSRHSKGMGVLPVFGRPRQPKEKIDIFVLMPFKEKMTKLYTNHIRKMGDDLGLVVRRADELDSPGRFMEGVWDGICAASLILADCTEKNPNVFYEIGMAHTVGKKVVLITRSEKDIPSDIREFKHISYIYDPEGVEALLEKLKAFVKSHFGI
jgi:hypothetical protein